MAGLSLKSSSVLEATLAITLLTIAFSIAGLVWNMVLASKPKPLEQRIVICLDHIAKETELSRSFNDERIDSIDFYIDKTIKPFEVNNGLYILQLEGYRAGGQLVSTHHKIVQINDH